MDATIYEQTAAVETRHWWFRARRRIVGHLLRGLPLPTPAEILEVGAGTGGNLTQLARYGHVTAVEPDERARALARGVAGVEVRPGHLPDGLELPPGYLADLVVLLDVLEHLEDDEAALRSLVPQVRPGGWLLLTVPALPALWSRHDESHHHRRRYRRRPLARRLERAGWEVRLLSYYNAALLPLIAAVRLLGAHTGRPGDADLSIPPAPWNQLLEGLLAGERHLLGRGIRLPLGVSLTGLARRGS
jgi:SAM-dependent methyltransferase